MVKRAGRVYSVGTMKDHSTVKTIDLTPTWAGCVNIYIGVLTNPRAGASAVQGAIEELNRMAKLADMAVAASKAGKL